MRALSRVGLAVAVLLGAASVASAGTVNLSGFAMGSRSATVQNVTPGNPKVDPGISVGAGALTGTVTGFNGTESWVNNLNFVTYCVELTEEFKRGDYQYNLVNGANYAFGSDPATLEDSFEISLRIGKLFSYLDAPGDPTIDSAIKTAAVQLAVWEIIYEKPTGEDLNVSNGNMTALSSAADLANTYLQASETTLNTYGVYVLTNANPDLPNQDWLALRKDGGGPSSVPEPTSLALAFGALGLLGVATRRRKTAKV